MSHSGEHNSDNSSVEESQFDLCEDAKFTEPNVADNTIVGGGNEGQIVEPIQPCVENVQANIEENNSKTSRSELYMGKEEKQDEPPKLSESQEKELETVFNIVNYPDCSLREELAAKMQLSEDFIQTWFIKRRQKYGNQKNRMNSLKFKWEAVFQQNNHPNAQVIEELATKADLPKGVIEVWFQNRQEKAEAEKERATRKLQKTSAPMVHQHCSPKSDLQSNEDGGNKADDIPNNEQIISAKLTAINEESMRKKIAEKTLAAILGANKSAIDCLDTSNGVEIGKSNLVAHDEMSEWESVFLQNNNPNALILEELATEAGVRKSVVEDWFQNRREQAARVEEEKAAKKLLQISPPPMANQQQCSPKNGPHSNEEGGNKADDIPNVQQQQEWNNKRQQNLAKLRAIEEELRAISGANKSATDCLDTSIGAEITQSNVVARDEQNGLMEKQNVAERQSKESDDAAQILSDLLELKRKVENDQAKLGGEQLNVVCRIGLWKYDNPKGNCWDKSVSQLHIEEGGLVGHKQDMGDWKQAFAQKPFQINANAYYAVVNYFEISTKLTGYLQSSIRLGLSADNSIKQIGFHSYASSDPQKSFAFDCYPCTGIMPSGFYPGAPLNYGFIGGMPNKLAKEPKLTGQNDVFGCGILQKLKMAPIIFYTAQGELIGQYCPMEAFEHHQLYPAIGLMNMATFEANFGDDLARHPFRYQIDKCPVLQDELLLV